MRNNLTTKIKNFEQPESGKVLENQNKKNIIKSSNNSIHVNYLIKELFIDVFTRFKFNEKCIKY